MKNFKIIFLCLVFLTSIIINSTSQESVESSIEQRLTRLENRSIILGTIIENKKNIIKAIVAILVSGFCIGYISYKSSICASDKDIKTNIDEKIV